MELSSQERQRCKEVFEKCDQFDSNDLLRDFMVIAPLKHFLRDVEAGTKAERIGRCIARLSEKKWNEQEVFISFVAELCKQYHEGDELHQLLHQL